MKNPPVIVLDNSALMKCILDEDEDQKRTVMQMLQKHQYKEIRLIEPAVWYYEAGNVLQIRLKDISLVRESLYVLQKFKFEESWSQEMEKIALKICFKYAKVSFYDACYHAIAIFYKGTFITADKKYFEIAKAERHIELLENYTP